MRARNGIVLVIDDDEADISFLSRAFKSVDPNISVVASTDPFEAEVLVRKHRPDLIFVDLRMFARSGTAVVEALRQDAENDSRPALMISSSSDPVDIRRSYASRANAYYVKPRNSDGYRSLAKTAIEHWLGAAVINVR